MPHGETLGTQTIQQGNIIQPRTPEQLDPSIHNDNLRFDQNGEGWTIEGTDTKMVEGVAYEYGQDIEVYANWLKKLESRVWCHDDNAQTQTQIEENLRTKVRVYGGENYDYYAFYSPTQNAQLSVLVDTGKVVIVNNNPYMFIGWGNSVPETTSRYEFVSTDVTYNLSAPIQFNSTTYLKTLYACFIQGTEIDIMVKTNQSALNNSNLQYNYTMNGYNTVSIPFSTINTIQVPNICFGESFICEPTETNPSIYDFKGWYIGNWSSENSLPGTYYNSTTIELSAIVPHIVLTALYLPATTNVYTITYHSGL